VTAILVVDDDDAVRDIVVRALERAGYVVFEANTGRAAMDVLRRQPEVGVVVSDVYMPDMDGFEFLTQASREPRAPKIIVMSGGGSLDPETILKIAARLGARSTLAKPFGPAELLEAVRAAFEP